MKPEQVAFVTENQQHFDLVLKYGQNFQRSHDVSSKVIALAEEITNKPVDHCTQCHREAYKVVWEEYLKQSKNGKKEANQG